jgi:hypothetical protein
MEKYGKMYRKDKAFDQQTILVGGFKHYYFP